MKYLLCAVFILLGSCINSAKESKKNNFISLLNVLNIPFEDKTYIIIPYNSCNTCREEAFLFLKNNISNTNQFTFIITEVNMKNELINFINEQNIATDKLYLDINYNAGKFGFYSIYPQVINIKNEEFENYYQIKKKDTEIWKTL